MRITRQAEYALQTIYHLSRLDEPVRVSTKSIAQANNIPTSFLAKIIRSLSVAGLIRTHRGSGGGVSLINHPSTISVLNVLEAIDGPITFHDCGEDPQNCVFSEIHPLHRLFCNTQALIVDRLKSATFDQFGPEAVSECID